MQCVLNTEVFNKASEAVAWKEPKQLKAAGIIFNRHRRGRLGVLQGRQREKTLQRVKNYNWEGQDGAENTK